MPNWIEDAEAALRRDRMPSAESSAEVIETYAPPLLDATGARALVAPFLAGFMWAALVFRETQTHSTLEPLALLFRVLAYALTLRAVRVSIDLFRRVRLALQRSRYGLVLTRDGLLLRLPGHDVVIPHDDILAIHEQHASALGAQTTRHWADVFVVTRPETGRLFIALPPIFGHSPRRLAEQLMRWRGARDRDEDAPEVTAEAPHDDVEQILPSRLWERVAQGEQLPGVAAVRHGYGWLERGPYASVLLGLAVLDGYVRLPTQAARALNPLPALLLAGALVILPSAWVLLTRARLGSRRGLALVVSRGALLLRAGRSGVARVPWSSITRVEVVSRSSWSLLKGAHDSRTLVAQRKRESNLQCRADFMAVPVEVVVGLCEHYRKRAVASASSAADAGETDEADDGTE